MPGTSGNLTGRRRSSRSGSFSHCWRRPLRRAIPGNEGWDKPVTNYPVTKYPITGPGLLSPPIAAAPVSLLLQEKMPHEHGVDARRVEAADGVARGAH